MCHSAVIRLSFICLCCCMVLLCVVVHAYYNRLLALRQEMGLLAQYVSGTSSALTGVDEGDTDKRLLTLEVIH